VTARLRWRGQPAAPAPTAGGVELSSVVKRYGTGTAALDVERLSIPERAFAVLVGPSGCGKSTTLRIVAGLEQPNRGRVFIDGTDVTDLAPGERGVGMVFQDYALYPHMTTEDNISFGLRLEARHHRASGLDRVEIARRVTRACDSLGLSPLRGRRPAQLSGGERQRVALARAIVRRPALLLLDEPLSALDAQLRQQARAELVRLHRELSGTMLLVTHDQLEALSMATYLVVMNGGRIEQAGPPAEVYNEPRNVFVARFLGSPPMNLATVTAVPGGFDAPGLRVRVPHPAPAAPAQVTVGWRPSDGRLQADGDPCPAQPGLLADGTADVLEFTGDGTVVHCAGESGRWAVLGRAGAAVPRVGDQVQVLVPAERLHLFDSVTGHRLPLLPA
jgi:multiple sugar transport system ATP-binding protein